MPDQNAAATEHAILQEITGPLESLPNDPLAAVHAEFPTALRGYERDAVDDYVRQTRRLVAELQATRSPEAAVRRALERVGEQISGILQRAHETAEQITAQSRVEAEDRLEQARLEARHIIEAADHRVRELDADTDRIWLERQRIVADAEDLAGQLMAVAREAGRRFPADGEAEGGAQAPLAAGEEPAQAPLEPGAYEAEEPGEPGAYAAETPAEPGAYAAEEPAEAMDETAVAPGGAEDATIPARGPGGTVPGPDVTPGGFAGEDDQRPTTEQPEQPRQPDPTEDATAIIPPSSQAANRRLHP